MVVKTYMLDANTLIEDTGMSFNGDNGKHQQ